MTCCRGRRLRQPGGRLPVGWLRTSGSSRCSRRTALAAAGSGDDLGRRWTTRSSCSDPIRERFLNTNSTPRPPSPTHLHQRAHHHQRRAEHDRVFIGSPSPHAAGAPDRVACARPSRWTPPSCAVLVPALMAMFDNGMVAAALSGPHTAVGDSRSRCPRSTSAIWCWCPRRRCRPPARTCAGWSSPPPSSSGWPRRPWWSPIRCPTAVWRPARTAS